MSSWISLFLLNFKTLPVRLFVLAHNLLHHMEILPPFKLLVAVRKEEMFGNSIKAIIKTSPDQSKSFAAPMQNTSVFLPLNVPFFAELLLRRADPILYCSLEIKYQQTGLALSGIKILEKDRD